jgi:hypothetical protein
MPSPFPGMNPYLEQDDAWQDFHTSFIPLAREALLAEVQPNYFVKVEEQLFIHELPGDERRLLGRSDLSITSSPLPDRTRPAGVLQGPARVQVPVGVDVERHSYLEIRDRRNRELVTVLELLSPSNKRPGEDRAQYLAKRRGLLLSPVHLVEIDLLRGGPRLPIDGLPECDYCILVSRAEQRPAAEVWHVRLRERLPEIPVPLRSGDPDARLDLQAVLHRVYDSAGYAAFIYTGAPEPPSRPDDAAWARQFVPEAFRPASG